MLRYQLLLERALDPAAQPSLTMRELARAMKMPIPSMHSYARDNVLPRIDNAQKMAAYFDESISSLFSDDDDLTADLVAAVRRLPTARKKALLKELK